MSYQVKVPLAIVRDDEGRDVYLYAGATVPEFVKGEQLERFVNEGVVEETGATAAPADPEAAKAPAQSAAKADWVAYAVAQGMAEEDASAATKEQLVEQYGR